MKNNLRILFTSSIVMIFVTFHSNGQDHINSAVIERTDNNSSVLNLKNTEGFWHLSGPRSYESNNPFSIFWHDGSYKRYFTINDIGNVGIGTAAPTYAKLQVRGGATHELFAVNRPNSDVPALYLGNAGNNNAVVAANNSNLTFGRDFGGAYTEYMRVQNNTGNVGIGTASPSAKLHVSSSSISESSTSQHDANFIIESSGNRIQGSGSALGFVLSSKTVSNNPWQQGRILVTPDNQSNNNAAGRMYLQTRYYNGAWDWRNNLVLLSSGNVGIGTTNTFGYKLAVNGTIGTKEVNVEVSSAWPDYVFAKDYNLKSLADTESYIKENQHLPEMPSAQEVSENGILLGEMNAKLLQKIEELTLHLISQQKRIEQLERRAGE